MRSSNLIHVKQTEALERWNKLSKVSKWWIRTPKKPCLPPVSEL